MSEHHDVEGLRAEVDRTREDLGETIDELAGRLDVTDQAQRQVDHARAVAADAFTSAKDRAPEPVQHAVDRASERVGPLVAETKQRAQPYRKQLVIGGLVALVLLTLLRRGRRH